MRQLWSLQDQAMEGLWMPEKASPQDTARIPLIRQGSSCAFPLEYGSSTARGRTRQRNEDRASCSQKASVFVLCDGIGGAPHGELASTAAANVVIDSYEQGLALCAAVEHASCALDKLCTWLHAPRTGTTLVAAAFADDRLEVAWLGDSKALLHRRDGPCLVELAPPDRLAGTNMLSACLGAGCRAPAHQRQLIIRPGDVLALCSDGVWEQLDRPTIDALLAQTDMTAPQKARKLVDYATAGGTDDATALVVEVGYR